MPEPTTAPTAFIRAYEQATNSHDIAQLAPLIASDAVLAAISQTFASIRGEVYRINELEWIATDSNQAVCRYHFAWTGTVDGQPRSGSGRGTNVLVKNDGAWQMLHEHLSA